MRRYFLPLIFCTALLAISKTLDFASADEAKSLWPSGGADFGRVYCIDFQQGKERCVFDKEHWDAAVCREAPDIAESDKCYRFISSVEKECQTWVYRGRLYGNADGLLLSDIDHVNRTTDFFCFRRSQNLTESK